MHAIGSVQRETLPNECVNFSPRVVLASCIALATLATLTLALSAWANVKIATVYGTGGVFSYAPYTILLPVFLIVLTVAAGTLLTRPVSLKKNAPSNVISESQEHIITAQTNQALSATPIESPHLCAPLDIAVTSAPMPGTCTEVFVKVGDIVEPGTPICVIEAMKMQNTIRAGIAGRVIDIVQSGEPLAQGDHLFCVQPVRT